MAVDNKPRDARQSEDPIGVPAPRRLPQPAPSPPLEPGADVESRSRHQYCALARRGERARPIGPLSCRCAASEQMHGKSSRKLELRGRAGRGTLPPSRPNPLPVCLSLNHEVRPTPHSRVLSQYTDKIRGTFHILDHAPSRREGLLRPVGSSDVPCKERNKGLLPR